MDLLRSFFSVLKSHDEHIRFAFISGESRFHNTTIFSGFNNPDDISLDEKYAAICGITRAELVEYFEEGIAQIGSKYRLSRQVAIKVLFDKYDGYRFTESETLVCNPFSLLSALSKVRLSDYWVMSGTSKILADYLLESHFSLDDLTSRWISDRRLVDAMMQILRNIVSCVPYHEIDTKVLERHIHLSLYIIFMMLGVSTRCEQVVAAGRVDMVAETPWRVYVMEFKIDGSPQQALDQIDYKGYAIPWESDRCIATKVGVNFSSSLRAIQDWKYVTM